MKTTSQAALSAVALATAAATVSVYILKKRRKKTYIIAGDIGGTNSRFALHRQGEREPLLVHVYPNESALANTTKSYHHATLKPFLEKCAVEVEEWSSMVDIMAKVQVVACLATAGPVNTTKNNVYMTNMGKGGQSIDGNAIEECEDGLLSVVVRCKLVNDFVGQGYGSLDLDLNTECIELMPGSIDKIDSLGPRACVGAGTGLGTCFLTKSSLCPELGYECYPSEGGHVDFVPRDLIEVELWEYLKTKYHATKTRISTERVVSGRGLADVYEFLAQRFPDSVDRAMYAEYLKAGDQQGGVIGKYSTKGGSLPEMAVLMMIQSYGAAVGNSSLKFIPTGGMFVTGGLTPKNIKHIAGLDSPFMRAYLDKGRMTTLLEKIPLFAVMTEDIGLRGARVCAEREYNAMK